MRQPLVLRAERGVLAGLRVDRLDLLERGRERVDLTGTLAGLGDQPGVLAGGVAPPVVELGDPVAKSGEGGTAEVVEDHPVGVALLEPPLVGLSVHRHEHLSELGEHPTGGRAATDVGPRPAGRGDRAGDDELAVLVVGTCLVGPDEGGWSSGSCTTPSTRAEDEPVRTRPESARSPSSRPRPETTIVLPAPVSPVSTLSPGLRSRTASSMTPTPRILIWLNTGPPLSADRRASRPRRPRRPRRTAAAPSPLPRQPATDRSNLATSRSVNGRARRRASRSGHDAAAHLDARTGRQVDVATPVAPHDPGPLGLGDDLDGELGCRDRRTSGPGEEGVSGDGDQRASPRPRARRPARRPRTRRPSSPVGVDTTTPSQPQRRQRPAVDLDGHLEHPLAGRLLDAHLVEGPALVWASALLRGRHVERHPLLDRVVAARRCGRRSASRSSRSASARKPTWPRLTPSRGTSVRRE